MFWKSLLALLLLVAVGGCAAEGRRYNATQVASLPGTGIIYVYRPKGSIMSRGESPYVIIDGKSYGQLKPGGFIRAQLAEGEYNVTVQQTLLLFLPTIPKTINVAVIPGSRSYVRVDQKISGVGEVATASVMQETQIEEVEPDLGQSEMIQMREN